MFTGGKKRCHLYQHPWISRKTHPDKIQLLVTAGAPAAGGGRPDADGEVAAAGGVGGGAWDDPGGILRPARVEAEEYQEGQGSVLKDKGVF